MLHLSKKKNKKKRKKKKKKKKKQKQKKKLKIILSDANRWKEVHSKKNCINEMTTNKWP